jgi:hypothetical protein
LAKITWAKPPNLSQSTLLEQTGPEGVGFFTLFINFAILSPEPGQFKFTSCEALARRINTEVKSCTRLMKYFVISGSEVQVLSLALGLPLGRARPRLDDSRLSLTSSIVLI